MSERKRKRERKLRNYQQWLFGSDSDSDDWTDDVSDQQENKEATSSNVISMKDDSTSVTVHNDNSRKSFVTKDMTNEKEFRHDLHEPKKMRAVIDGEQEVEKSEGCDNDTHHNSPLHQLHSSERHLYHRSNHKGTSSTVSACPSSSWLNPYRGVRDPLSGWVRQPSQGIDALSFADSNRPSTWANSMVPFVYIHSAGMHPGTSTTSSPPSSSYHVGKWLWFVENNRSDEVFVQVACSLAEGLLGQAAKAPPPDTTSHQRNSTVVIVYTCDYRDEVDVLRVIMELRRLGAKGTLSYKPDVFTLSQEVRGKGKSSIYQHREGATSLMKTCGGVAMEEALVMSTRYMEGTYF